VDVRGQGPAQSAFVADDDVIEAFAANRADQPISRSAYAFCHGECGAVRISSMPIAAAVVVQAEKAASRSRTKYRGASFHGNASRSCCAVQADVGWSVMATCTPRRRSWVRITSTNRSRHVAVGTTKKSAAAICVAWFARNVRHNCDGNVVGRAIYLATVA